LEPLFTLDGEGVRSGYFVEELWWTLAEYTANCCCRDAGAFSDLAKALAMLAVILDSEVVQHQRISADVPAF